MNTRDIQPLDDLEMFELLQAAYPERFPDESDTSWHAAMEFASELNGFDELADLLGRVALLTVPMQSALSGRHFHCLGKVEIKDGKADMVAAVRRCVAIDQRDKPHA